eukprot:CAMPEP_0170163628 /NCGR_PEP_ID=MMETSP0033_2-20121228/77694_1 /TAXON_ID=195969 /ORGANISM="Dolichomastix tenuilepis, Strain CCMP3274" /LENGTH=1061 /DNA_ID=CAMNT_0010401267 /DNA_START=717 /DNA_END=3902 /DNA_ORIENTATION=-
MDWLAREKDRLDACAETEYFVDWTCSGHSSTCFGELAVQEFVCLISATPFTCEESDLDEAGLEICPYFHACGMGTETFRVLCGWTCDALSGRLKYTYQLQVMNGDLPEACFTSISECSGEIAYVSISCVFGHDSSPPTVRLPPPHPSPPPVTLPPPQPTTLPPPHPLLPTPSSPTELQLITYHFFDNAACHGKSRERHDTAGCVPFPPWFFPDIREELHVGQCGLNGDSCTFTRCPSTEEAVVQCLPDNIHCFPLDVCWQFQNENSLISTLWLPPPPPPQPPAPPYPIPFYSDSVVLVSNELELKGVFQYVMNDVRSSSLVIHIVKNINMTEHIEVDFRFAFFESLSIIGMCEPKCVIYNICGLDFGTSSSYPYGGQISISIKNIIFQGRREGCRYGTLSFESEFNPVVIDSCEFYGNNASGSCGGAIGTGSYRSFIVRSSSFIGNHADSGGAICSMSGYVSLFGNTFYSNYAADTGGALFGGFIIYEGNKFEGNLPNDGTGAPSYGSLFIQHHDVSQCTTFVHCTSISACPIGQYLIENECHKCPRNSLLLTLGSGLFVILIFFGFIFHTSSEWRQPWMSIAGSTIINHLQLSALTFNVPFPGWPIWFITLWTKFLQNIISMNILAYSPVECLYDFPISAAVRVNFMMLSALIVIPMLYVCWYLLHGALLTLHMTKGIRVHTYLGMFTPARMARFFHTVGDVTIMMFAINAFSLFDCHKGTWEVSPGTKCSYSDGLYMLMVYNSIPVFYYVILGHFAGVLQPIVLAKHGGYKFEPLVGADNVQVVLRSISVPFGVAAGPLRKIVPFLLARLGIKTFLGWGIISQPPLWENESHVSHFGGLYQQYDRDGISGYWSLILLLHKLLAAMITLFLSKYPLTQASLLLCLCLLKLAFHLKVQPFAPVPGMHSTFGMDPYDLYYTLLLLIQALQLLIGMLSSHLNPVVTSVFLIICCIATIAVQTWIFRKQGEVADGLDAATGQDAALAAAEASGASDYGVDISWNYFTSLWAYVAGICSLARKKSRNDSPAERPVEHERKSIAMQEISCTHETQGFQTTNPIFTS